MFKKDKSKAQGKFIDIESAIEGNLKFTTPVNLKINSRFEGALETKGTLFIGEKADIEAKIVRGEDITISGRVKGDIISSKRLELTTSAKIIGNIKTPRLIVNEGAILRGNCDVSTEAEKGEPRETYKSKKKRG